MSISSEIQRISGKVSDSFDAVVAKGGTVTSRKIADLPTAIGTISGGGSTDEYANVIGIENVMKGTSFVEEDEIDTACDNISMFLYGTANV